MHLWLQHTPALSESKVHRPLFRVVTCNAMFFQRQGAADLLESDAIIVGMDAIEKSAVEIPFPALAVCPFSRGATSKYDAEGNIIGSGVMICIVSTAGSASVYKIWPHHCGE